MSEPSLSSLTYASRLQYKTPNLSGRLQIEEVKQAGLVTRSTQRALSLKKNWVSDAPASVTTGKKSNAAEMDGRLKSLMERLSNQQSLLKPADKPSSQMEHMLKNFPSSSSRMGLSQSSTSLRDPAKFKSPPPLTTPGSHAQGSMANYHFYPSPYLTSSTTTASVTTAATTTVSASLPSIAAATTTAMEPVISELVSAEESSQGFKEVERLVVPEMAPEVNFEISGSSSSSESSSSDSSSESTQSENLSPLPPPIPPAPIMVPDIQIHDEQDAKAPELSRSLDDENVSRVNESSESVKEEFESCLEIQDSDNKTNDQNFPTPGMSLDESADCSSTKDEIILDSPLATSSPMTQSPKKEAIVVKVI